MEAAKLEAILIGNAAAALQEAPVTTMDLDFYDRDALVNRKKLVAVANQVNATLTQPFPQLSSLYRMDYGSVDFPVYFLSVAARISSIASSMHSRLDLDVLEKTPGEIEAQTQQD